MADWYPVEMAGALSGDGSTSYWVVDVDVNTDSTTGKRYGAAYYRSTSRKQAIELAEWLNTPAP